MPLPPPVRRSERVTVSTDDRAAILTGFAAFIRQLHAFLNGLPCLRDFQATRGMWARRVVNPEAFGEFVAGPGSWFTRHIGGVREAQFNIALSNLAFLRRGAPPTPCPPPYFRVGLGFAFAGGTDRDRAAVAQAYRSFLRAIGSGGNSNRFEQLVHDAQLEGEWYPAAGGPLRFVPTEDVTPWLTRAPEANWLFIGRMLRCGVDAHLLEDPVQLAQIIEATFTGFRPLWDQAMGAARAPERSTWTDPPEGEPSLGVR
jgi:hypothetical protein